MSEPDGYLGFSYLATKRGEVFVRLRGRWATTLRGTAASDFLLDVGGAGFAEQQQIMARVAGNGRLAESD